MRVSIYQKQRIDKKKSEIFEVYKRGLSLRKVAKIFDVSHQYVSNVVKELEIKGQS